MRTSTLTDIAPGSSRMPTLDIRTSLMHHGIVGSSRVMTAIIDLIELVSATASTVLITGETGTGKELVARAIHCRSGRHHMPFVPVNCAAIPAPLLESELFGHVRGAYTGAVGTRKGKFPLAHGGTIFLDEIGSMSVDLQAKLLRVLQEREVEPLGAERTSPIDVRVIAATNRDLRQLVAAGQFQEDLFYRLNVIPIAVPPLRERPGDIPLLADHFVAKHAARAGRCIAGLEDGIVATLQSHTWPGNVRELENTIERAVVLTTGRTIAAGAVTIQAGRHARAAAIPSLKLRDNVEWVECETIRQALQMSAAKREAARILGISPRALSYYLAKYPFIDQSGR